MSAGTIPGVVLGSRTRRVGFGMPRTGRRLMYRAVLLLTAAGTLVGVVDQQTVTRQAATVCGKGQVAITVPRLHIWPVSEIASGPGPALRDVMARQAPQVALTAVIAANPSLRAGGPMGNLPRAAGGRVCLDLPRTVAVESSALVLRSPERPTTAPTAAATSTAQGKPVKGPYAALFAAAGRRYGIDPALLSAQVWAESGYNPRARSPMGALGLAQLMPGTARRLHVNPLDPAQAIDGQAREMSRLIHRYHSVALALAAYNAGDGAIARYHGIPPFPETCGYVSRIMSHWKQTR